MRCCEPINRRLEAIGHATALTTEEGVIAPNRLLVQALVSPLRVTRQAIEEFDQTIAERAQHHPEFALGAGQGFAPRLLVAFGEQRERYRCAAALQRYAGIAPVTERSAKSSWVHWRRQCPRFLRQTFVEWSGPSIPHCFWARAYYQQQRRQGKSHPVPIRALAFKWIRILFRCWQTRTPDDESVYLSALQRRGAPLLHNLVQSA